MTGRWWRQVIDTLEGPWVPHPRSILILSTLVLALIASACLGPDEFDPTGSAPIGRLDAAIGDGASIRVIGWVIDPDVTGPINVEVTISNKTTSYPAKLARPDVAAARPRHGPNHGFDVRSQALPPGVHQVCVWAKNVGRGTRDRGLGCADVRVTNDNPVGKFESVAQVDQNRVRVIGWAHDPDAVGSIDVLATFTTKDATGRATATTTRLTASASRPELSTFFRRATNFGIDTTVTGVRSGDQTVCLRAVNQGRGTGADLGCRAVRVNDSPGVPARATLSSSVQVAPPVGHPLRNIDRDAGVSVGLGDGARLWLFGDSSETTTGGSFKYFVNNTAALTMPGEPAVPRDAVDVNGRPFTFVTPTGVSCPAGFTAVMWPTSANVVATTGSGSDRSDTVLAFFANVCLSGDRMLSRGIALVRFEYHHGSLNPTAPQRLSGQVLTQHLFPKDETYGDASIFQDGWLYAYRCGRPSDESTGPHWPDDPAYDGCRIARARPEVAADAAAWTYWNGADPADDVAWSSSRSAAATMTVPGDGFDEGDDRRQPPASFVISQDPHWGFVFVYSPWPGYSDEVVVRTAGSPTGPWSDTSIVPLPGCNEWAFGRSWHCYAGTAQTWRSSADQIGIGYYDQFAALNPSRGAYVAASAPN